MTKLEKNRNRAIQKIMTLAAVTFIAVFVSVPEVYSQICAVPGSGGPQTISGVVNSYYPSPTTATASGTSIPVGAIANLSSSLTPIASGDLLLIIQVQDALINSTNSSSYGAGTGTGRGFTSGNAGLYEYAVATNNVGTGGGTITTQQSLARTYESAAATGTRGRRTYQVIRIPQYSAVTISGTVNAASWDGTSGGIVAFDVAGTLNMGGGTINANGRGFRAGLGISLSGGSGSSTDYRGLSTANSGGSKGEGIAGTPRHTWDGSLGIDNGIVGYPNGTFLRGAPGNAGGGGTDGSPSTDNGQNSGGGGGGNGGAGGTGGNSWSSNLAIGGIGGDIISAAANRIVFGGGGGAGTSNNGANATSSGGLGGGIVIIRAGAVSGSGTITANGANAPNSNPTCCGDGAGGGGAGGSIMITAANSSGLSGISTSATGGKGGDTLVATVPHGPGAGGGGGIILSNGSLGSTNVSGGINGTTTPSATFPDPAYGAQPGQNGLVNASINPASVQGAPSGADCIPVLTVTKSTSTPTVTNSVGGTSAIYSISVQNAANKASATQLNISDTLPQPVANGFTFASTTSVVMSGGATRPSTTNPAVGAIVPLWSQFTIPGGGSVVLTFTAAIAPSVPSATYQNPATATYLDPTRTVSNGTRSVSYNSASSTNEDVQVIGPPNINLVKACTLPVNCTTVAQQPNTELTYKIDFSNTGGLSASNLVIVDKIPENTDFKIGSVIVTAGTTGLTFVVEYSSDYDPLNPTLATWVYTPVSGGGGASAGYDRLVKAIRWRVTAGSLSQISPNNAGSVSFITKIR